MKLAQSHHHAHREREPPRRKFDLGALHRPPTKTVHHESHAGRDGNASEQEHCITKLGHERCRERTGHESGCGDDASPQRQLTGGRPGPDRLHHLFTLGQRGIPRRLADAEVVGNRSRLVEVDALVAFSVESTGTRDQPVEIGARE